MISRELRKSRAKGDVTVSDDVNTQEGGTRYRHRGTRIKDAERETSVS